MKCYFNQPTKNLRNRKNISTYHRAINLCLSAERFLRKVELNLCSPKAKVFKDFNLFSNCLYVASRDSSLKLFPRLCALDPTCCCQTYSSERITYMLSITYTVNTDFRRNGTRFPLFIFLQHASI